MSDLDARVAALMTLADKHASSGIQITADQFVNRKDPTQARCDHLADYEALESAIRAELQKTALHEPTHPEDTCELCQGPNIKSWFAPSPIWNAVAGEHDILCPQCFVDLAAKSGVSPTAWRLAPEDYVGPDDDPEIKSAKPAQEEITDAERYKELLYAVGNKYPGESRHETALRYIRRAESNTSGPAGASKGEKT